MWKLNKTFTTKLSSHRRESRQLEFRGSPLRNLAVIFYSLWLCRYLALSFQSFVLIVLIKSSSALSDCTVQCWIACRHPYLTSLGTTTNMICFDGKWCWSVIRWICLDLRPVVDQLYRELDVQKLLLWPGLTWPHFDLHSSVSFSIDFTDAY